MGIREVTNREFKAFLSVHNSGVFKSETLNGNDQPVVQISWKKAALFCNWLSKKEGLPPVYAVKGDRITVSDPVKTGYRLPTEAEWEYCARIPGDGASQKYPWGTTFPPPDKTVNIADMSAKDLLPAVLDTYDDGYAATAPPGTFQPNKMGLHDLGGNVSEWCHDFYTIYPYSPGKVYGDPIGPAEGKHHVVRGSSWQHASISAVRAAYRDYSNKKRPDLGFRVARYAK
jgi:formylglycine-generating enzyme required for sulfatase activity